MSTILVALAAFIGYFVAYHTYGRWLARRIFSTDRDAPVPSRTMEDGTDYVATRSDVVFGHHFTSIAGTGPIVGPAIAVFWGWLPALLWVLFGAIFIGAVHDFAALVVSLRNQGHSIGDIAGRVISPRARILFLLILAFTLVLVMAVFGLVIAKIFELYPQSVLAVWGALPLAIIVGVLIHRRGHGLLIPSLIVLGFLYFLIGLGAYLLPLELPFENQVVAWTIILLVYCFFASVLPVWLLLQPRDFINSHMLFLAMFLLVGGLFVAGVTGQADLFASAPPLVSFDRIQDAPPIFPFLFITVACGAISGFHALVSSGTTSKQLACETDASPVGYGGMLLEGALAVMVILACCAGIGMGVPAPVGSADQSASAVSDDGAATPAPMLTGRTAWLSRYGDSWTKFNLGAKVGVFVDGGANFIASLGIPWRFAVGVMAVLVASFAATTLDTATRLQRYVIQELATTVRVEPLTNKYVATLLAVVLAGFVAMLPGPGGGPAGTGGLILWPLFGALNQLLAGLTFVVVLGYLWRRRRPVGFLVAPLALLLVMPSWAMLHQMFHPTTGWLAKENYLLLAVGAVTLLLQVWMLIEATFVLVRARGVLEQTVSAQSPS